jgi:hypothetical protein
MFQLDRVDSSRKDIGIVAIAAFEPKIQAIG